MPLLLISGTRPDPATGGLDPGIRYVREADIRYRLLFLRSFAIGILSTRDKHARTQVLWHRSIVRVFTKLVNGTVRHFFPLLPCVEMEVFSARRGRKRARERRRTGAQKLSCRNMIRSRRRPDGLSDHRETSYRRRPSARVLLFTTHTAETVSFDSRSEQQGATSRAGARAVERQCAASGHRGAGGFRSGALAAIPPREVAPRCVILICLVFSVGYVER